MTERALQLYTKEYLDYTKQLSPRQIVDFLEDFRQIAGAGRAKKKSKLISIKIPEELLQTFKTKAKLEGVPYQTLIKKLMQNWLLT